MPIIMNIVQPMAHLISAGTLLTEMMNARIAKPAASKNDIRKIIDSGNLV